MRKNAKNCCFLNDFFTYYIQKYLILHQNSERFGLLTVNRFVSG